MKQAGIYVNDIYCGVLTEDEEGFHFVYDATYLTRSDAAPVSPTMPLREQQSHKPIIPTRKDENQLSSIIRQANRTIIKQKRRKSFGISAVFYLVSDTFKESVVDSFLFLRYDSLLPHTHVTRGKCDVNVGSSACNPTQRRRSIYP